MKPLITAAALILAARKQLEESEPSATDDLFVEAFISGGTYASTFGAEHIEQLAEQFARSLWHRAQESFSPLQAAMWAYGTPEDRFWKTSTPTFRNEVRSMVYSILSSVGVAEEPSYE